MSDLISRESVIEIIESVCSADNTYWKPGTLEKIRNLPTHETPSNVLGALDCVSRQAAIDAVKEYFKFSPLEGRQCAKAIERVPSAQSEIIRCKDCKHSHMTSTGLVKYCDIWFSDEKLYLDGDYFCADAELRGDSNVSESIK